MDRNESWRPLFKGRREGAVVEFICFSTGGFAIVRGEQVMRLEPKLTLEGALDLFMSMIDRPATRFAEVHATPAPGSDRLLCA